MMASATSLLSSTTLTGTPFSKVLVLFLLYCGAGQAWCEAAPVDTPADWIAATATGGSGGLAFYVTLQGPPELDSSSCALYLASIVFNHTLPQTGNQIAIPTPIPGGGPVYSPSSNNTTIWEHVALRLVR